MKIVDAATANTEVLSDVEVNMIISALKTVVSINQVSVDIGNDKDKKAIKKIEIANSVLHKFTHINKS